MNFWFWDSSALIRRYYSDPNDQNTKKIIDYLIEKTGANECFTVSAISHIEISYTINDIVKKYPSINYHQFESRLMSDLAGKSNDFHGFNIWERISPEATAQAKHLIYSEDLSIGQSIQLATFFDSVDMVKVRTPAYKRYLFITVDDKLINLVEKVGANKNLKCQAIDPRKLDIENLMRLIS
jgi:hypothetical protein